MGSQILLATDLSECSAPAGRVASEYARRLGARLHVLHVTPAAAAAPALEQLVSQLDVAGAVMAVETGAAVADEIVRYAARQRIELIVMGTHGRTGFSRALLGSVAERVVRTAPCPVITVPYLWAGAPPAEPAVGAEPPLQRCLVCRETSADLICERCRARIRGEALEHKRREERAGRT